MPLFRVRQLGVGLAALVLLVASDAMAPSTGESQVHRAGYAWDDPNWRFTHGDRPVKVVLLAGSIGAFRDMPYGRLLHEWCGNAEIRNLSMVGHGAPQLLARFRSHVLENPGSGLGRGGEAWLLYGGGLNSVGLPYRTNHAVRETFELAHSRNMRIVSVSLTPWGDDGNADERWAGAGALRALRSTRSVVGFVLGSTSPRAALGPFRTRRSVDPDAPWNASERGDVRVDLYDSRLRDPSALAWSLPEMRERIRDDRVWQRRTRRLSEEQRALRLETDAFFLSQAPRWFLRDEYQGFDHIHPNRAGHRVIAETICPELPRSWGCSCPRR